MQSIDVNIAGTYLIAAGYSNEFENTVTTSVYPWVARFPISRTSANPVMDWGVLVQGLPDYQVVSITYDLVYNTDEYVVQMTPINCVTGLQYGYIIYYWIAHFNRAWKY